MAELNLTNVIESTQRRKRGRGQSSPIVNYDRGGSPAMRPEATGDIDPSRLSVTPSIEPIPQNPVALAAVENRALSPQSPDAESSPQITLADVAEAAEQRGPVGPSSESTEPSSPTTEGGTVLPPSINLNQTATRDAKVIPEASFQMPDGSTREIYSDQSPTEVITGKPAPTMEDGTPARTYNIDGGSFTVPVDLSVDPEGENAYKVAQNTFGYNLPTTPDAPTQAQPSANQTPMVGSQGLQSPQGQQPQGLSPQQNFEQRIASGQRLSQSEIEQAQRFAERMPGFDFDPRRGYVPTPMSMAEATRLTSGDRGAAEALREQQRQGYDPISGQPMQQSGELSPSEQLARERFEYEKSQESREVDELQQVMDLYPNLSRADAWALSNNKARVIQDPVTGATSLYNMASGESSPIDIDPSLSQTGNTGRSEETETVKPPIVDSEPNQSLYEMAKESTGIANSLKLAGQAVLGQAGIKFGDAPEVARQRQEFNVAKQQLIRSLSINPKFPAYEQKRIAEEINITPGAWLDEVTLDSRMEAVDNGLRDRVQDELAAANDISLGSTERRAARQSANDINNFLDLLGYEKSGGLIERGGKQKTEGFNLSEDELDLVNKYIK